MLNPHKAMQFPSRTRLSARDGIWTAAASQRSPTQTVFFANRHLVKESPYKHQRILCVTAVELEMHNIRKSNNDWRLRFVKRKTRNTILDTQQGDSK